MTTRSKKENESNSPVASPSPKLNTSIIRMASDWDRLQKKLKERFDGEMDYDSILFLIGLQELGKPFKKYKKDEKLEVMHVAICSLLEPYGFYEFMGKDDDGWPHWKLKENLPFLDAKQQNKLIIDSIIDYFKKEEFI